MHSRKPAVAGRFYTDNPQALRQEVSSFFAAGESSDRKATAIISPHAGYVYSGRVAARAMAAVSIPKIVVIIGPNHHGRGNPAAVSAAAAWETPFGPVPVNTKIAQQLVETASELTFDDTAHELEHSLEVQVPLLQFVNPALSIVPLVIGRISLETCQRVGEHLATVIAASGENILIVASSDMTHYLSRSQATAQDILALEHVKTLDWQGLYRTVVSRNISMCGVLPVVTTLVAAQRLGATSADIIEYTDSGAVNGDTSQVVGYAGVVIE